MHTTKNTAESVDALPKTARSRARTARRWIVATTAMVAVALVAGCASTSASNSSMTPSSSTTSGRAGYGNGGASNARSGPAEGGTIGTVSGTSSSGFTLTTSAGEKVTVDETSSTTYQKGTGTATASAVTTGEPVEVLGTVNSTTITAGQVVVQPPSDGSASGAAQVVPFQRGAPSTAKQIGQIPANYTEGSGTIMTGTTADKATEAALATYPGGVVDRVVQLSGGEYEVHYIGVNWPHHVFVSQQLQVVGAD